MTLDLTKIMEENPEVLLELKEIAIKEMRPVQYQAFLMIRDSIRRHRGAGSGGIRKDKNILCVMDKGKIQKKLVGGISMPMTREDMIKTANWFRAISASIMARSWPDDEIGYVRERVADYLCTANKLENEAMELNIK